MMSDMTSSTLCVSFSQRVLHITIGVVLGVAICLASTSSRSFITSMGPAIAIWDGDVFSRFINYDVGTIIAVGGSPSNVPMDWHLCDGSAITDDMIDLDKVIEIKGRHLPDFRDMHMIVGDGKPRQDGEGRNKMPVSGTIYSNLLFRDSKRPVAPIQGEILNWYVKTRR